LGRFPKDRFYSNDNSATLELFNIDYLHAFYGKAMLIVRWKPGKANLMKMRTYSGRLKPATAKITTE